MPEGLSSSDDSKVIENLPTPVVVKTKVLSKDTVVTVKDIPKNDSLSSEDD